jgi:hypothetical protein
MNKANVNYCQWFSKKKLSDVKYILSTFNQSIFEFYNKTGSCFYLQEILIIHPHHL